MRTNYEPKTKEQLREILNKIESKYPSTSDMYKDLEVFYNDVEDIIGEGVGTDIDYCTWEPDNDTYAADLAIDDVVNIIYQSEKNGRLVANWVCDWIGDMLFLLISYK